jgi:hypothetical protein
MTKQFTFQKIQGSGRAIELYESVPDVLTAVVSRVGGEFLPRAGFPLDRLSHPICLS